MRAFLPLLGLTSLAQVTQALYFFLDGTTQKCFYEELPKDTLVVGHYTAEEFDDQRNAWWKHDGISIFITVDVCQMFLENWMLCADTFFTRNYSTTTTE